jgi:hypothetical protein
MTTRPARVLLAPPRPAGRPPGLGHGGRRAVHEGPAARPAPADAPSERAPEGMFRPPEGYCTASWRQNSSSTAGGCGEGCPQRRRIASGRRDATRAQVRFGRANPERNRAHKLPSPRGKRAPCLGCCGACLAGHRHALCPTTGTIHRLDDERVVSVAIGEPHSTEGVLADARPIPDSELPVQPHMRLAECKEARPSGSLCCPGRSVTVSGPAA